MIVRPSLLITPLLVAASLAPLTAPAADVSVRIVSDNLAQPCAVVIRPGSTSGDYEIFVAETGAGRVRRFDPKNSESAADVIIGLPSQADRQRPLHSAGPRGLHALDLNRLVVSGADPDDSAYLRIYEWVDGQAALAPGKAVQEIMLNRDTLAPTVRGVHALARTSANGLVPDRLVLSTYGKDRFEGLWSVAIHADTLGEVEMFGAGDLDTDSRAPVGIAMAPYGHLVVGQPIAGSPQSRLLFLHPIDGKIVMELKIELPGIVGLAFSPSSGDLYAASVAEERAGKSGIYRIVAPTDASAPRATITLIKAVDGPSALTFAPDGTLYITTVGRADAPTGSLLGLSGEL